MDKEFEVYYEDVEDILSINTGDKIKFSVDLAIPTGDVIVDLGYDGLVKGIEIFNASKFFLKHLINLKEVIDAKILVNYTNSYAAITLILESKSGKITSNIILPYNKKIILTE
jgi:uncharacterized protein YuzE